MDQQGVAGQAHPEAGSPEPLGPERLSPELVELATSYGVATEYWDWQGQHVVVPEGTVRAVLAALGVDASTPQAARAAAARRRDDAWRRMLPATVV
ncbi:MAG TPA: hypothetical protein VFS29_11410, partial [Motilibacteraceae bacterium]|nr:hypothetical protein [Motilibacteraceae bacterium]